MVVGSEGCGKSTFIDQLIKNLEQINHLETDMEVSKTLEPKYF